MGEPLVADDGTSWNLDYLDNPAFGKFFKECLVGLDQAAETFFAEAPDQRLALREKGAQAGLYPHQLIMTATPIPRTLAMTAYADLDT